MNAGIGIPLILLSGGVVGGLAGQKFTHSYIGTGVGVVVGIGGTFWLGTKWLMSNWHY